MSSKESPSESERRSSQTKRNYSSLIPWIRWAFYIVLIGCAGFIALKLSTSGFVPEERAVSIVNALLDVDIALVAFFGLILVFNFNYINGVKDRTAREKHEISIQRDRFQLEYLTRFNEIESDTLPSLQKVYFETYDKYTRRIEELDKEFQSHVLQIGGISVTAIITLGFIFVDILLNIYFLGAMTNEGLKFPNLFTDLAVLLSTLFVISESLLYFQPKTERDIVIKELKRQWAESEQRRKSSKKTAEGS
jgi:hypothetical protein